MLFELYYPQSLSPARLDRYLAGGWFRSRDFLYRSQMICLEEDVSPVINVRLKLDDFKPSRSLRKVLNKNRDRFRFEIREARIDREKEALYQMSKPRFKGMVVDSLSNFFFEFPGFSVFNTYELCVYHHDKLVAVSFFDLGEKSVASLLAVYDDAFREFSPGMYTMLQEVQFAKDMGKKFYYPGYVIEGSTIFDYKLRLGNMQFYNWKGRWLPLGRLSSQHWLARDLKAKMSDLARLMNAQNLSYKTYLYPSFSLGYIDILPDFYLKSAMFFCLDTEGTRIRTIIEYLPEEGVYRLCKVMEAEMEETDNVEISDEFLNSDLYFLRLLGYEEVIQVSENPKRILQSTLAIAGL